MIGTNPQMYKFIYVFSEDDRQKLLEHGFQELYETAGGKAWVFLNQPMLHFSLEKMAVVLSNQLTFD